MRSLPHPIPYQGSKRSLATHILSYFPDDVHSLYEPFAGSAAVTIAAGAKRAAKRFVINDLNKPLMELWKCIIEAPHDIFREYQRIWHEQLSDPKLYYFQVREEFNRTGNPALFLYLLARCVKASVRYNVKGEFNQSPDNRRKGMKPETMRFHLLGASNLLGGKTETACVDYREIVNKVTPKDFIYMDPPYQGVGRKRDPRYLQPVNHEEFIAVLDELNRKGIRYLVSYDGRTGSKTYGLGLPQELGLTLIELNAGRSSQATLLGRKEVTFESLYLSPALSKELSSAPFVYKYSRGEQLCLLEGHE